MRISIKREKIKGKKKKGNPNSNHRTEEYNSWTEKLNRGFSRRLDQEEQRINEHGDRTVEFI